MKPLFISVSLFTCLLVSSAAAQETSILSLEQSFALARSADADLITAQADVTSTERDLTRVLADPLALRLEKLQAQQAVASAQAKLVSTQVAMQLGVADAYTTVLEADESLSIAQQEQTIAAQTLEAQRIRLSAGAVTQLDVDRANNNYQAAVRSLADAQASRNLAYASLSSLVARNVSSLEALSDTLLTLPALDEVVTRAQQQNAQLLAAAHSVDLNDVRLAAVNNDFSARSEIEAAQDSLRSAQISLAESQRSLELSVQNSYNSVVAAQTQYDTAGANYNTALSDLTAQKTRLDAGSISLISYAEAELGFARTLASLSSAKHNLYLSLLRLEQSIVGQ